MAIIQERLNKIETEHDIKILFATEAGSRVWRMSSADSDYDVRFVFMRPMQDYLKMNKFDYPDCISINESPYDYVGFDIYKFAKLLMTSNPSMIEWLQSDMTYIDRFGFKRFMLDFIQSRFNPMALHEHYRSMCKQNYLKYLKSGECMTYKKYLYAMRGLVNALWVATYDSLPPIDFNCAIQGELSMPSDVADKLKEIISLKKEGKGQARISKISLFEDYIETFLSNNDTEVESRKLIDTKTVQDYILNIVLGGK